MRTTGLTALGDTALSPAEDTFQALLDCADPLLDAFGRFARNPLLGEVELDPLLGGLDRQRAKLPVV